MVAYQPLPQDEPILPNDDAPNRTDTQTQSSSSNTAFIRSPTYYSDGPFPHPSSLDEDEDPTSEDVQDSLKYRSSTSRCGSAKVRYPTIIPSDKAQLMTYWPFFSKI